VIERVDKAFRAEPVEGGVDIGLQREHVGDGKLPAGFEHAIDAFGAPGRVPLSADAVGYLLGVMRHCGARTPEGGS